jgi:hypothetical protein
MAKKEDMVQCQCADDGHRRLLATSSSGQTSSDSTASTCFDYHMGTVPSDLSFHWFKTVDGVTTEYKDVSGAQLTETAPAVGKYVTYTCEAFSELYAAAYAPVSTTVYLKASKLQAVVLGGDRVATVSAEIALMGETSTDPDENRCQSHVCLGM